MKGFSLVWVLTWRARCSSFVKDFEHQEHKRSRLFRRRSLGILCVVSRGVRMRNVEVAKPVWGCGGANLGFAKCCLLPRRRTPVQLMNLHAYAEVIQADSRVSDVLL